MNDMSVFMHPVSPLLINNFVLSRFLGSARSSGVSQQDQTALGMGDGGHLRDGHRLAR